MFNEMDNFEEDAFAQQQMEEATYFHVLGDIAEYVKEFGFQQIVEDLYHFGYIEQPQEKAA